MSLRIDAYRTEVLQPSACEDTVSRAGVTRTLVARMLHGCVLLAASAALAGCATQMDTPSPTFGQALNAAKDAQRITPVNRDDGLRPLASELPAGVMPPAGPGGAGAGQTSSWGATGGAGAGGSSTGAGSSGLMILPAGR